MEAYQKPAKRRSEAAWVENGSLCAQALGGTGKERLCFSFPLAAELQLRFAEKPEGAYCRTADAGRYAAAVGGQTRQCAAARTQNVLIYRITAAESFAVSLRFSRGTRAKQSLRMDEAMNLVGETGCLRVELETDEGMVSHAIRGMTVKLARSVTLYFAAAADMQACKELIRLAKEEGDAAK